MYRCQPFLTAFPIRPLVCIALPTVLYSHSHNTSDLFIAVNSFLQPSPPQLFPYNAVNSSLQPSPQELLPIQRCQQFFTAIRTKTLTCKTLSRCSLQLTPQGLLLIQRCQEFFTANPTVLLTCIALLTVIHSQCHNTSNLYIFVNSSLHLTTQLF